MYINKHTPSHIQIHVHTNVDIANMHTLYTLHNTARTHARTHAHTHARMHARTHTH